MTQGYSFADAPGQNDFSDLLPHGLLSWAWLKIRPFNLDQGIIETPSQTSDARYLNCELTLEGGPGDRRKVFTRIGVAGSEKYINMGRSAIRAILEVGRGASAQNPQGYVISAAGGQPNWLELDGLKVAIKVRIEKGTAGYPDKNDVAVWLSPIADSGTEKLFARLLAGDVMPAANQAPPAAARGGAAKPAAATQPAWTMPATGQPAHPGAQQPTAPAAPPSTGKPSWLA